MKRPAEPASVEDVSDETNNTIPSTRRSATSSDRPSPKRKRTIDVLGRSKTKSATAAITCHSRDPVPLVEAVRKYDGAWPMTIRIERDIFMTNEDAEHNNPRIWIEQRTFASGKEASHARQLFFLERVLNGNVYIFKGCGDQILGVEKLPDLHLTARVVSTSPMS